MSTLSIIIISESNEGSYQNSFDDNFNLQLFLKVVWNDPEGQK